MRAPLIHLDELKSLDLLRSFDQIYVPEAVWREVQQHRPSALRRRKVRLHRAQATPEPTPELVSLVRTFSLGAGEEEAFRLLQRFPDATLLTDDAIARLLAQQMGYSVHGTIGILLRGLAHGLKTKRQVLNLLKAIPQRSTLHITKTLLHAIIAQVQENAG